MTEDKRVYACTSLIGGASGALDALPYNSLQDGELAFTVTDDYIYVHIFDANSSSSESSPDVIAPDDVGTNTGRWLLRLNFLEPLYIDRTNSRVGLGKSSPDYQLDITEDVNLENTTHANQYGIIYKEGSAFLHNFNYGDNGTVTTEGHNLFVGVGAGNFTMGSTATETYHSSYNVGVGDNTLYSNTLGYYNLALGYNVLYSNTEGHDNLGIAANALYSNTTGHHNFAIGQSALYHNSTGVYNLAIGPSALYQNTAAHNLAIGQAALYSNTTGIYNLGIGESAGRYIANGSDPNQTSSQCIFIGSNTKASADGVTNEVVIGYDTTGKGSNTVVLGNDSIVKTFLKGKVSVGVADPSEAVHVSGKGYFTEGVRVREDVDDYGGNFTNYTPPTGASALIILVADTNATNPGQRLYAYVNGSWRYVDLT